MPVTSNLKKQVDLPIYEWLRPVPTATTAISAATSSNALASRYLYYVVSTLFCRYDTYSDSWSVLASPITTLATLTEIQYNSALGYYGQAIGPGTGNNTVEMAALNGKSLVGYKIRILSGKGAGQERTITDVSDPIIKDRGIITTVSQSVITDASTGVNAKQWKSNEYKNYQVRIDYGAGVNYVRKILYNNATSLTIYDTAWTCVTPWWGGLFPASTSLTSTTYTNYQIESNIVTVDSAWDIAPDSTSKFVVLSGGILCISSQGGNPYFNLQYYDVIADTWYRKSAQTSYLAGGLATDISFERFNETRGPIASGTSTSITSRTLYNTGVSMETGRYANLQLRIKNGSGNGQFRTILTNTSSGIYLTRDWDITPNQNSSYEIYGDTESIYMIGHGASTMYQYNLSTDQWTTSKQLDFGVARNISYFISGENDPIGISSIARTTNGIYTATVNPISGGSGYLLDQVLTIAGGTTNGTARITSVNLSGAVLSISMQTPGAGYTSTGTKSTTVNPLGGAGCAIDVITTGDVGTITTAINHNAKINDIIFITGVTGSAGFEVYNGYKTVVGSLNSSSTVFYITGNFPAGTPLSDAQSTTRLVDVNKNIDAGVTTATNLRVTGLTTVGIISAVTNNARMGIVTFQSIVAIESGAQTITIAPPSQTAGFVSSYTLTLPSKLGTDGQVLALGKNGLLGFTTAGLYENRFYVSAANGDDTNDGRSKPVKTIKRAAQLASFRSFQIPGGRYLDAGNLLQANKEFIKEEVVAYVEFNYAGITSSTSYNRTKCKRDIGYIVDAVSYDISYGGNSKSIEAGNAYWNAGASYVANEKEETIFAYNYVKFLGQYVINNQTPPTLYQIAVPQVFDFTVIDDPLNVGQNRYRDARNLILGNRQELIDRSLASVAVGYPSAFYFPGDTQTNVRSRYYDSYGLIQRNKQEIVDKSLASIAVGYPTGFTFPGEPQTSNRSRYYDSYRLIVNNKREIVDKSLAA